MLVGEVMTQDPIVVYEDTPVHDALKIVRDNQVRRLPVLNDKGALVGVVSEKDLLYVSSPPATSLSIYELHYLITKIKVADVMTATVITVTEDIPLEEAARIMIDNKIGCLPVERGADLVGIVTETDLFKIFVEFLEAQKADTHTPVESPQTVS